MALELNLSIITENLPLLLKGAGITLEITALSVGLGLLIGMFVGVAKLSDNRLIRGLASVYVDCIRGTPLLVQIFLVYFALPQIIGHRIDPFVAAVGACSINSGAYVAEIFRAGIQSIDKGQMEAARSLGMNHKKAMQYIILPQAVKRVIPPLCNEFIVLLKDTSLLAVIGVTEIMKVGQIYTSTSYAPFPAYIGVACVYLILTFTISRVVHYVEVKWNMSSN